MTLNMSAIISSSVWAWVYGECAFGVVWSPFCRRRRCRRLEAWTIGCDWRWTSRQTPTQSGWTAIYGRRRGRGSPTGPSHKPPSSCRRADSCQHRRRCSCSCRWLQRITGQRLRCSPDTSSRYWTSSTLKVLYSAKYQPTSFCSIFVRLATGQKMYFVKTKLQHIQRHFEDETLLQTVMSVGNIFTDNSVCIFNLQTYGQLRTWTWTVSRVKTYV